MGTLWSRVYVSQTTIKQMYTTLADDIAINKPRLTAYNVSIKQEFTVFANYWEWLQAMLAMC